MVYHTNVVIDSSSTTNFITLLRSLVHREGIDEMGLVSLYTSIFSNKVKYNNMPIKKVKQAPSVTIREIEQRFRGEKYHLLFKTEIIKVSFFNFDRNSVFKLAFNLFEE